MGRPSIEALLDAFQEAFQARAPFREDRALSAELRAEARPVLDALLSVIDGGVPLEQEHEAFALLTLLCRRAGLLGATPAAAHALTRALGAALEAAGLAVSDELAARIEVVAFEGYCGGRDERLTRSHVAEQRRSQVLCTLAPRCVAAFLSGAPESEHLTVVLEDLGRLALHQDALSCMVDVSRLSLDDEDVARALFDGLSTLASLGSTPLVCMASGQLDAHRTRFGDAVPSLQTFTEFGEALGAALAEAGHELKARRRWPRDLFSRGRPSGSRG